MPQTFHTPGGHAVSLSGALGKLFFMVGHTTGQLRTEHYIEHIVYIPVVKWKGQLPKQITTKRVNRAYNLELDWRTKEHNVADAIALGHWYLRERKKGA